MSHGKSIDVCVAWCSRSRQYVRTEVNVRTVMYVHSILMQVHSILNTHTVHRITATMENILRFNNSEMRDILKFYYSPPAGLFKMNKDAMAKSIAEQLMVRVAVSTENTADINAAAPELL